MFVVFDNPTDFPGEIIVRENLVYYKKIEKKKEPEYRGKDLEAARTMLREKGLTRIPRHPTDEPAIVEVWL